MHGFELRPYVFPVNLSHVSLELCGLYDKTKLLLRSAWAAPMYFPAVSLWSDACSQPRELGEPRGRGTEPDPGPGFAPGSALWLVPGEPGIILKRFRGSCVFNCVNN